ncbi:MAG: hypothetical protein JJE44_02120 [Flavobacteriaceae bacterium]|nr:hypothetical protein [Flavobacteriaceae bacterium]
MKKIYLYFTKASGGGPEYLNAFVDKTYIVEVGKYQKEKIGFYHTKDFCQIIYQEDEVKVEYDKLPIEVSYPTVFLVSDNLQSLNEDITNILKVVAEKDFEWYCFFHNGNQSMETSFKKYAIESKLKFYSKKFSHFTKTESDNWDENPFYRLAELFDVKGESQFEDKIKEFEEEYFGSYILNQKLTLLHKLLGDQKLDDTEKEIAKTALHDYVNEIKGSKKIEGIRKLRDELLKDVI